MFSVPARSFLAQDKFSDSQLLWLRDITSQVTDGQAILGENTCFFNFFEQV